MNCNVALKDEITQEKYLTILQNYWTNFFTGSFFAKLPELS